MAAGIFVAGMIVGGGTTALISGETSPERETVYDYETFHNSNMGNGYFSIERKGCKLAGRVALHVDTIEQKMALHDKFTDAMEKDPKTEIPLLRKEFSKNVSWVKLHCDKPAPTPAMN
jgi:hypothetical protein